MVSQTYYIAYASKIALVPALYQSTFLDIQSQSQTNNKKSGITGFLLFKDGKFFQYFEGNELACQNLLLQLYQDRRHKNLTLLAQGPIDRLKFQHWAMACFDLQAEDSVFESRHDLPAFNVFHWQLDEVSQVIAYFARDTLTGFQADTGSYAQRFMARLVKRHQRFLLVEGVLLVLILLAIFLIH